MDVFLSITAFLCCLVGIVGCIVPVLPGPVLSYAGLFCAYACSYSTLTPAEMWLWAGLTAAVTAADYFLPGYMAKLFGGTRAGMVGATVGMIAGLFVGGLIGIVIGQALVVGVGSFLSFLVGTGIKLVAAVGMLTFVVADTWPALRAWFATVF